MDVPTKLRSLAEVHQRDALRPLGEQEDVAPVSSVELMEPPEASPLSGAQALVGQHDGDGLAFASIANKVHLLDDGVPLGAANLLAPSEGCGASPHPEDPLAVGLHLLAHDQLAVAVQAELEPSVEGGYAPLELLGEGIPVEVLPLLWGDQAHLESGDAEGTRDVAFCGPPLQQVLFPDGQSHE